MAKHILIVATNYDHFAGLRIPTGAWLSELVHALTQFEAAGHSYQLVSPHGGIVPLDPRSLHGFTFDSVSRARYAEPAFRELLATTEPVHSVDPAQFDGLYLVGGHGAMYDFPDNRALQNIIATLLESGRPVASVCHGASALLNVESTAGPYLVRGRELTAFSWLEERLSSKTEQVPFNLESSLTEHGASYQKHLIPFFPKVVTSGKLITGQNPFSSKRTAKALVEILHLG